MRNCNAALVCEARNKWGKTVNANAQPQHTNNSDVLTHVKEIYEELIRREGFGEVTIAVRILKRGQKEVLVRCIKESRFVVDGAV